MKIRESDLLHLFCLVHPKGRLDFEKRTIVPVERNNGWGGDPAMKFRSIEEMAEYLRGCALRLSAKPRLLCEKTGKPID